MGSSAAVDWSTIDHVLLDMDGTLLDLAYDNWFWREHVPLRYAERHRLPADLARSRLAPRFQAVAGTMDWYCIDYWSRELDLDIGAIKRACADRVRYLPGAERFLERLRGFGKRVVLVTNAHPETLAIKDERVALTRHFDAAYSSHPFAVPKEHPEFWPRLRRAEPFDPARTLFVDDSLAVLESARGFGIGCLRAVRRPDTDQSARDTQGFTAVDGVLELI
ncbi:MAG: GMP/IMP nucleotidase [Gammaproteobacteria bacterium]|nr:GMP/IMP nucleotidase [Gammaproteobacteria bacterium]